MHRLYNRVEYSKSIGRLDAKDLAWGGGRELEAIERARKHADK